MPDLHLNVEDVAVDSNTRPSWLQAMWDNVAECHFGKQRVWPIGYGRLSGAYVCCFCQCCGLCGRWIWQVPASCTTNTDHPSGPSGLNKHLHTSCVLFMQSDLLDSAGIHHVVATLRVTVDNCMLCLSLILQLHHP